MKHKILVIGGGASGIIAAITAKDLGADVAILEGSDRICKKLLTTGNGRCNITNSCSTLNRYNSSNPDFVVPALSAFDYKDTIDFFNSLGLPLITLEEGKMYPMSLQASSVVDILRFALDDKDIPLYTNSKVNKIKPSKNGFKVFTSSDDCFEAEKLILCCGGKSAPGTGSDGSGFSIAKTLGHSITPLLPALVQLKLDYKSLKAISGVKFNGIAKILVDNKVIREEFGEILFTDYGISGPPILQLSRIAAQAISNKSEAIIDVNLLYNMSSEELDNFLEARFAIFNFRSIHDSFIGVLNKKLIPVLLKQAEIDNLHKPCYDLTWKEKKNLKQLLQSWKFKIYDTNGFNNAQVTSGGIDTSYVNANTLESTIIPNLYFAGEILDVDADCGGFNLQWAWSSGNTAAINSISNK